MGSIERPDGRNVAGAEWTGAGMSGSLGFGTDVVNGARLRLVERPREILESLLGET